jgi:hypothetical protein
VAVPELKEAKCTTVVEEAEVVRHRRQRCSDELEEV